MTKSASIEPVRIAPLPSLSKPRPSGRWSPHEARRRHHYCRGSRDRGLSPETRVRLTSQLSVIARMVHAWRSRPCAVSAHMTDTAIAMMMMPHTG